MPELPETETIARDLDREVAGRRILQAVVRKADVLREVTARALQRAVADQTIVRSWRRAKLIVLDLSGGHRIVVQPRFTGAMLVSRGPLPDTQAPYSTLHFAL